MFDEEEEVELCESDVEEKKKREKRRSHQNYLRFILLLFQF
jgi:hypothetical protein